MIPTDLEALREIFKDVRMHIGIGIVKQLGVAQVGSALRVQVALLPEQREIITLMSFADVYDVTFPEINDMVLVAFVEGSPDDAYIVGILNSTEELIPEFSRAGHSTKYARPGKKLYIGSDTFVGIARPDSEPTEPLVLGQVLVTFLTTILSELKTLTENLASHVHMGNLGYLTSSPTNASDISGSGDVFDEQKASPIEDHKVLSDLAATEK